MPRTALPTAPLPAPRRRAAGLRLFASLALALAPACKLAPLDQPPPLPKGAVARSLYGRALVPPPLEASRREELERQLADARAERDAHPEEVTAWVRLGRRTADLGRFDEAVEVYTEALARFPGEPHLLRHRGHRYLTLRRFAEAQADLALAARALEGRPDEDDPEGATDGSGKPLETLHSNVAYHLGLALYLQGELEPALQAFRHCIALARNPDTLCSATYWTYLALRGLGREDEARAVLEPIRADLEVARYREYHALLLVFRGELDADALLEETAERQGEDSVAFATIGYGVGCWHLFGGRAERAFSVWRRVLRSPAWHAFGCIATEAHMARLRLAP